MTDAEREAELRHGSNGLPRGGDVAFVRRLLDEARAAAFEARQAAIREGVAGDEARAEIEKRHQVIEGQGLSMAAMSKELREKDAEIARLRERSSHANSVGAPPEADAMERARRLVISWSGDPKGDTRHDMVGDIARALAEYKPNITTDTMELARLVCKDLTGYDHADIYVEVVARALADYGDQRAREARTEAFAAGEACAVDNALSILDEEGWLGNSRKRIRALADTPQQPEAQ